jgi:hypothetical protein
MIGSHEQSTKSKKIISLQLHFKYQRTKDQGPRPRLKWREGAVYSITSNTRGPRTKDQTEVERRCSLQTHFKYQRTKDQTEVERGCSLQHHFKYQRTKVQGPD